MEAEVAKDVMQTVVESVAMTAAESEEVTGAVDRGANDETIVVQGKDISNSLSPESDGKDLKPESIDSGLNGTKEGGDEKAPLVEPDLDGIKVDEAAKEPAESDTQQTYVAPEPAEAAPEPAEAAPEPAEAAPEPAEAATEPAEAAPEPAEAVTEPAEAATEPSEAATEPAEAATEPAEAVAKPAEGGIDVNTKDLDPDQERQVVEGAIQDLMKSVREEAEETIRKEGQVPSSTAETLKAKYKYTWTQSESTIQINIPIDDNVRGKNITVDLNASSGSITVLHQKTTILLEGYFFGIVSNYGMTWQIDGDSDDRTISIEVEKGSLTDWQSLFLDVDGVRYGAAVPDGADVTAEATSSDTGKNEVQEVSVSKAAEAAVTDDPEGEDDVIELDTRTMPKNHLGGDEATMEEMRDLRDEILESLQEEDLMRELEREMEEPSTDDRIASDASMNNGDIPLAELLEYYKAVATGQTQGRETVEMAAMQVALFYSRGIVVETDYAEARKWYQLAAERGNDVAMFHLGLLYQEGLGMAAPDVKQALEWWGKAADAGNANAMYNLGVMYINGHGVEQDTYKAIEYFGKAKELDPSLPFPPFTGTGEPSEEKHGMPLTEEEKIQQRQNTIQNLRYMFWTTTFISLAAVTFFSVRYWWKNRL